MPTDNTQIFAATVAQNNLATEEQVAECLEALKAARASGDEETDLGKIMLEKGYLTEEQAEAVYDALEKMGQGPQGPQAAAPKKLPKDFGQYEIQEKIGRGGMGMVYKAKQVSLNRLVAIKILAPRLAASKNYVDRFLREARSAAALQHPNIVGALDVGEEQGFYFFAMEYLEGQTLAARLKREGPLSEKETVRVGTDVAKGLVHAHQSSLIHRDIKPENLMQSGDGLVKVMDFGLAKSTEGEAGMDLTVAGRSMLTPYYASIEQIRGQTDIDIRSDIYSLGATLYHLVTGKFPFPGETAGEVMLKHSEQPAPDARAERPELSVGFSKVLMKCMAKDPAERYAEPQALLDDLEAVAEGRPPVAATEAITAQAATRSSRAAQPREAKRTTRPTKAAREPKKGKPKKGKPAVLIVAAAIFGVLVIGGVIHLTRSDDTGGSKSTRGPTGKSGRPKTTVPRKTVSRAERMFRLAQKYAGENPDDLNKILKAYELVLDQKPKGKLKAQVDAAIAACKADQVAAEELGKIELEAETLMGHQKYAEALAAFDQVSEEARQTALCQRRMPEIRRQITTRSETEVTGLRAEAAAEAAEGVYYKAKALYEKALAAAMPEARGELQKAVEEMAALEAKRMAVVEAEQAQEEQRAFVATRKRLYGLIGSRKYAEAEAACEQEAGEARSDVVKECIAGFQKDVALLKAFWQESHNYVAGIVGSTVLIQKQFGQIAKVEAGTVFLKTKDAEVEFKIDELPLAKVREFVSKGAKEEIQAAAYAGLGLVYLYEDDPADALKFLEQAQKSGADVAAALARAEAIKKERSEAEAKAAFQALLAKFGEKEWNDASKLFAQFEKSFADTSFAAGQSEKLKEIRAEAAAYAALEKLRGAARAKRQDEALKHSKALLDQYTQSQVVATNRDEIDKILAWAESGDISPGLFAARKARISKDGKVELFYDFEVPSEFSGDFAPMGSVSPYNGIMYFGYYQGSASGRGCHFRYLFHGDFDLKFQVRFIGQSRHLVIKAYGDHIILDGASAAYRKEMVGRAILADILQTNPNPFQWNRRMNDVQVIRKGGQGGVMVNEAVAYKWKSDERVGQIGILNAMTGPRGGGPAAIDNLHIKGTLDVSTQRDLTRQAALVESVKRASPKRGGFFMEFFSDSKYRRRVAAEINLPFYCNRYTVRGKEGLPPEKYSVRSTGYLLAPAAGTYTFSFETRFTGIATVIIDEKLKFSANDSNWKSQSWELSAGLHKMAVEYVHKQGEPAMRMSISSNVAGHQNLAYGSYLFYDERVMK